MQSETNMLSGDDLGGYEFTNDWFESTAKDVWDELIPEINPSRILEIGSYEGKSACYIIDKIASKKNVELHCIDTWEGGLEHKAGGSFSADMNEIYNRFNHNIDLAVRKSEYEVDLHIHHGCSDFELSKLFSAGKQNYFDFIYIDGSHQAADVLCDALLSFRLLRVNGIIAFDDYLWQESLQYGVDPIRCPKWAIDVFTNIYCRKVRILRKPLNQLFVKKTSE